MEFQHSTTSVLLHIPKNAVDYKTLKFTKVGSHQIFLISLVKLDTVTNKPSLCMLIKVKNWSNYFVTTKELTTLY